MFSRLLDQLDRKTDTTQNRLRTAQQRLNKFIKDNAGIVFMSLIQFFHS